MIHSSTLRSFKYDAYKGDDVSAEEINVLMFPRLSACDLEPSSVPLKQAELIMMDAHAYAGPLLQTIDECVDSILVVLLFRSLTSTRTHASSCSKP